jgi:archaellum biogenesis protein FlaJ (TadC family)
MKKAVVPKTNEATSGMRKFWMAAIVVATLLVGLVVMLAFNRLTDPMWTAWCTAVAGTGLTYGAANVVTKVIDGKNK